MSTNTLGNDVAFSWAIMSLFAWLLPHISMEVGEYHRALGKSALWSTDESTLAMGAKAIRRSAIWANLLAIALIVGAACGVAINTKNLDSRMVSIVTGLSRLVGSAVLFGLSWNFPEWLEVYHIRKRRDVLPVTRSVQALKFNVFMSVTWRYTIIYFFLLPFYCGAGPATIPVAATTGIVIGCIVDLCVYLGRKQVRSGNEMRARYIVFAMIFVFVAGSAVLFADGCLYINDVWGGKETEDGVGAGCFFGWLVVGAIVHFALWRRTKDSWKTRLDQPLSAQSFKYKNVIGKNIAEIGPKKVDQSLEIARSATKTTVIAAQRLVGNSLQNQPPVKPLEGGADGFDEEGTDGKPATSKVGFVDQPQDKGDDAQVDQQEVQDDENEEGRQLDVNQDDPELQADPSASIHELQRTGLDKHINFDEPTYLSLAKEKFCACNGARPCCCCCCCYCLDKDTRREQVVSCAKWTTWAILCFFSLYVTAVNLGATYQQDVVRHKLPSVKVALYKDMNDIEVCAYDGDGTEGSLNENSIITTFESEQAAHDAGYLILHCGPCAACSTWPNIKYEYTTRTYLAAESARCARKSLFGGKDAVHSCLMAEPINWDDACGMCWTIDVLCAKKYCAFNFIQSTMINTMTNFAVGMGEVTAATCEEANCEAFDYPENFVECSGATRRRMNVTSSIARPKDEECANVDVKWEVLFPGE